VINIKVIQKLLFFAVCINFFNFAYAIEWPDTNWINERPKPDALMSAVAFVSPTDLEFYQITALWKRLERKYRPLGVDFLIITKNEAGLPYSTDLVTAELGITNYKSAVYIDEFSNYSKLWKAFISPTVHLVLKSGKLVGFDSNFFDPAIFEKVLQKTLKESGAGPLPPKELLGEGETKTCGHSHTVFLSEKYQESWGSVPLNIEGVWTPKPLWMEKKTSDSFSVETSVTRSNVALVAGSPNGASKISVTLDGLALPAEIRGRDIQVDKLGNTFIMVKTTRMYELINHSSNLRASAMKIKMITSAKGITIWSIQTLPFCQTFS
jgi:hypothetical protein